MHIIKIGAEHKISSLPLTFYGETGFVFSYFTDISDTEYNNYHPVSQNNQQRPPAIGEYLRSTSYIFTLGFRLFK
jgi:hypothetical protein